MLNTVDDGHRHFRKLDLTRLLIASFGANNHCAFRRLGKGKAHQLSLNARLKYDVSGCMR